MFDDTVDNNQQVEQSTVDNDQSSQQQPQQRSVDPSTSFRELREKAERVQRERDDAVYRLQQYEMAKQQQAQEPEDYDIRIAPDDIAEGKHLVKLQNKIQSLEKKLNASQQRTTSEAAEYRIRAAFPDFDKVVSSENVRLLNEQHPDIANAISQTTDMYSKASSAYKLIKQFGLDKSEQYNSDKEAAQRNMAKPKPSASMSNNSYESPIAQTYKFDRPLTDEAKKRIFQEMNDIIGSR